jgi:multidrug efflux pump
LGALRTVAIPVITIPLSLVGVCSLMFAMGYSLNLLTLLAMVLSIGLVVDDAIVVVENIYRHIEEGHSPFDAAILGAREIAMPIISMTTTLAAVYAPIGFMSGVTGALFKEFAFTLAFTVIISGVIALTLSPMMCSKILNVSVSKQRLVHLIDEFFEKLKQKYQLKLRTALHHRSVIMTFALIMLITGVLLALTTPTELAPEEDQSILFLSLTGPEYANVDYTTKFTNELIDIYKDIPETEDYFIVNGMGASNNAVSGLILKPWNQRSKSQSAVNQYLQPKIAGIAGLNAVAFPLPSIPGSNDGLPIQFVVTGTVDYVVLDQVISSLQEVAMKSGLFMFLDSDLKFNKPELEISINRNKAAAMGIKISEIGNALATMLGENSINRFSREGQSYLVIPQVPREFRFNPDNLNHIYVASDVAKELVPLSSVVSVMVKTVPSQLNTFQQLNSATLQGMMAPGKSISEGLDFLRDKALKLFPTGVFYDYAGQSRQMMEEGSEMLYTFLFALLIIYLVLSAQFESFRDPLIILVSVPLSITGALIPLHLGLATLNIYTGIGLVTLIGLISKHGILMVDFANKIKAQEGLSNFEAILKSASLRLRPILMTTAAMILGVLPLLLASGAGARSRFDIGLVISSGMLVGTGFTLFVVPAMYTLFAKK